MPDLKYCLLQCSGVKQCIAAVVCVWDAAGDSVIVLLHVLMLSAVV